MSDIENLWKYRLISKESRRFYIKLIKSSIRMVFILFICRYFIFIPKISSPITT